MDLIFDTSILIDSLRGGKKLRLLLDRLDKKDRLFIPTIVLMEIFSGKSTRIEKQRIKAERLLSLFERIGLNEKISIKAGELSRDLDVILEVPDYIVAATALETNAAVVTLNKKHFSKISNLLVYPL